MKSFVLSFLFEWLVLAIGRIYTCLGDKPPGIAVKDYLDEVLRSQ